MSSLRNLDLNLLKVFDAVYVSGSVSEAAKLLGVSQPSVSRGLGRLREHFDDPLFVRVGNGVSPTPIAEGMLESVRAALVLIGNTIPKKAEFDPHSDTRNFRLLLPDPAEVRVMPHLINLLPRGSNITFEVLAYSNVDLSKAFSSGDIDAGVLPFVPQAEDIVYRKLYTEKGALIARRGHPSLADGFNIQLLGHLDFIALPDHIYRLSRLDEVLRTLGLKINVMCTTHKISSMPRIVETTDLVAFLPLDYANMIKNSWEIDVFPVPDTEMSRQDVYLAQSRAGQDDPSIEWICSEIDSAYAQLN